MAEHFTGKTGIGALLTFGRGRQFFEQSVWHSGWLLTFLSAGDYSGSLEISASAAGISCLILLLTSSCKLSLASFERSPRCRFRRDEECLQREIASPLTMRLRKSFRAYLGRAHH